MTAREMRPKDVPHEYVMVAMKAAGLLNADTARAALAAVLPVYRADVLVLAAEAVDASASDEPLRDCYLARHRAAWVVRDLAAAPQPDTTKET